MKMKIKSSKLQMNKIITIYCEGKKGSHDFDILEKIIVDIDANITIKPIGGIRGGNSIVQYLETEVVKSNFYLLFRDRDFDRPIPTETILEKDGNKSCYFSYRNTIENYLFDVDLFYKFVKEKQIHTQYDLNSLEDVKNKFIEAAQKIKYYQAIRHTLGAMRKNTDFGTKLEDNPSGRLPDYVDNEEYCRQKALEKIKEKKDMVDINWTELEFDKILASFLEKFNTDTFMNELKFLVYFQGKDFGASLKKLLPHFPLESYYKYAKNEFNYSIFSDLKALHQLLKDNLTQ